MNQTLIYLMDELCAGLEIYYAGRTGGQYYKTAYILCDDYSELVSKLFLLTDNKAWTDKKKGGKYKHYHDVLKDVENVVAAKMEPQLSRVKALQAAMKKRRERRNEFFHSTKLLDLSVNKRNCIEAFCDLFEYGMILLGDDWREALKTTRNLATLEIMLQLEKRALSNPAITARMNNIIQDWPRNTQNNKKKGVHMAVYPEDIHLILCVISGGEELREKLQSLLS